MSKNKRGICMADGGIAQQETPEQLMARIQAKYGVSGNQPAAAPRPAPVPQPVAQAPQGGQGIMGLLKGRAAQIDKAVNGYANGGIAGGVKFEGKGGPRDDQIPVKVAGQNINVSNGEQALIIPAKTAANAQAMEMIKQIIADSNDGRQPSMGGGDANFAEGGLLDEEARKMDYQAVTGVQAPAPTPQPVAQPAGGGWSLGKSGPGATLQVTTGDAARLPAPVVQQGIATMRGQMATPQPAAVDGSNYVGNGPTDPDTNSRQAIAAPSGAVQRGIATMRGQLNQNPMVSESARASAAENAHVQSLYPAGTFDKPAAVPSIPGVSNAAAATPQPAAPGNDIRAKHQAILNGQQSVADQGAIDALKNKTPSPMQQDMPLTTKDLVPGGYLERGDGILASRNKDGQLFVSNSGATGAGIAGPSQGNPNLGTAEDNLRQIANIKALQDSTPQGGIGILGDGGIEAANAEKTTRWRQDELLTEARRGNQAAVGAAINANASMDNEASRANSEQTRAGVAMRGQDMAAKNDAARIAASADPEGRQLKQAQAAGIMGQLESTKMMDDIKKKALAGDPQALASYRALTQKGGTENMRDNFMAVGGGQEFDAAAGIMRNVPQRLVDLRTGQEVGGKPQAAQQAVPPADKREVGKTYQTPKGPLVWRGNGWEAA